MRVKAGDIFFAIAGTQYDGRDFIKNAIEAGAVAVVTSSAPLAKSLITMQIVLKSLFCSVITHAI